MFRLSSLFHDATRCVDVTNAVPESGHKSLARDLLNELHDIGFKTPFLNGGALRDMVLGLTPRDFDLRLHSYDVLDLFQPQHKERTEEIESFLLQGDFSEYMERMGKYDREAPLHWIKDILKSSENFQDFEYIGYNVGGMILTWVYRMTYKGMELDVRLTQDDADIPFLAMCGDAPINGAVMTHEGRIYAHPLFLLHAENRIYSPSEHSYDSPREKQERFEHLAEHVEGLQHIPFDQLPTDLTRPCPLRKIADFLSLKVQSTPYTYERG